MRYDTDLNPVTVWTRPLGIAPKVALVFSSAVVLIFVTVSWMLEKHPSISDPECVLTQVSQHFDWKFEESRVFDTEPFIRGGNGTYMPWYAQHFTCKPTIGIPRYHEVVKMPVPKWLI